MDNTGNNNRICVNKPQDVIDNEPGGKLYEKSNAHLYNPFCTCDKDGCPERKRLAVAASGGGSRYGEIAGVVAYAVEQGHKISNMSGCSAGSIVTVIVVSGAGLGIAPGSMLESLEASLNEPDSIWPWVRKKQRRQRTALKNWIEEYWDLCRVPWGTPGRIRNLMTHMIRLCAPCNKDWSSFSPGWSDPGTIMMFIQTAFCGGVNNNQKLFSKTASLFPEKFHYSADGWLTDSASILMVDVWNTQPKQIVLNKMNPHYDQLGPHYIGVDEQGNRILSAGKNPALAGITFSGEGYKTVDAISASCAIPALMKAVKFDLDPSACAVYNEPEAAKAMGYLWPPPPKVAGEFYDGGLWQTIPIFQTEINPDSKLIDTNRDRVGSMSNINIYSPYLATSVYSKSGGSTWKQQYYTGPWNPKPGFWKRNILSRVGKVIETMHNCATWDQVCDQMRDREYGGKSTLACTDFKEARDFLSSNPQWGTETYPRCDHSTIKDMPDSRTMKDGWTDELMIADVALGYLSAKMQGFNDTD